MTTQETAPQTSEKAITKPRKARGKQADASREAVLGKFEHVTEEIAARANALRAALVFKKEEIVRVEPEIQIPVNQGSEKTKRRGNIFSLWKNGKAEKIPKPEKMIGNLQPKPAMVEVINRTTAEDQKLIDERVAELVMVRGDKRAILEEEVLSLYQNTNNGGESPEDKTRSLAAAEIALTLRSIRARLAQDTTEKYGKNSTFGGEVVISIPLNVWNEGISPSPEDVLRGLEPEFTRVGGAVTQLKGLSPFAEAKLFDSYFMSTSEKESTGWRALQEYAKLANVSLKGMAVDERTNTLRVLVDYDAAATGQPEHIRAAATSVEGRYVNDVRARVFVTRKEDEFKKALVSKEIEVIAKISADHALVSGGNKKRLDAVAEGNKKRTARFEARAKALESQIIDLKAKQGEEMEKIKFEAERMRTGEMLVKDGAVPQTKDVAPITAETELVGQTVPAVERVVAAAPVVSDKDTDDGIDDNNDNEGTGVEVAPQLPVVKNPEGAEQHAAQTVVAAEALKRGILPDLLEKVQKFFAPKMSPETSHAVMRLRTLTERV